MEDVMNKRKTTGLTAGSEARCQAGAAKICINPPLPAHMAGYAHERIAETVDRDLFASAIVIKTKGDCLVLVSCDLINMTDEVSLRAFRLLSSKYKIPMSNFIACATHTHSGPEIRILPGKEHWRNEEYIEQLASCIERVVEEALLQLFDAIVRIGCVDAPGLAFNRNSRCSDGDEITQGLPAGKRIVGYAGPLDDSLQTIGLYDEATKSLRAVAVNFGCHAHQCFKAIDSDWPGEMADYLRRIYGEQLVCLTLQGTAGDRNHYDYHRGRHLSSSDFARGIAGSAMYALQTSELLSSVAITAGKKNIELPYYTRTEMIFEKLREIKAKGEDATYFEKTYIDAIESWKYDRKIDELTVSCMRIGDIAVVALPGEIFTDLGLEIKRYSPARQTLVVAYANGANGRTSYVASVSQSIRGARGKCGYGAMPTKTMRHEPIAAQLMVDAAIELLYELWPKAGIMS